MNATVKDDGPITIVNLFELDPDKVDAFVPVWLELAKLVSSQPGYRSLRILRALSPDSRFLLINVAEWDSEEQLASANARPEFRASLHAAVEKFGVIAHPAIDRIVGEGAAPQ